jgi:hypothetical protein
MPLRRKLTHIIDTVHGGAATGECQPLHVPPLGAPEAQDSLLGEGVQREGVHALLVDHHKALVRPVAHLYNSTSLPQHNKYPRYSRTAVDPDFSMNPDPAFQVNPDPDPIRIQSFDDPKKYSRKFLYLFVSKIAIYLFLSLRRSLQPSKENIQHFKKSTFLYICGSSLPSPDPDCELDTDPGTPLNPEPQL